MRREYNYNKKKCSQVEIQQENILQVNTLPHQLIGKEERHGECDKSLRYHSLLDHKHFSCNDMEGVSGIHEFHGVSS